MCNSLLFVLISCQLKIQQVFFCISALWFLPQTQAQITVKTVNTQQGVRKKVRSEIHHELFHFIILTWKDFMCCDRRMLLFVSWLLLLLTFAGLAQSLGFYLEPIKQREIKSPKDLERGFLCFRYELEDEVTVVDVRTGGEITNQKLNVVIKDQNFNTLRRKDVSIKEF